MDKSRRSPPKSPRTSTDKSHGKPGTTSEEAKATEYVAHPKVVRAPPPRFDPRTMSTIPLPIEYDAHSHESLEHEEQPPEESEQAQKPELPPPKLFPIMMLKSIMKAKAARYKAGRASPDEKKPRLSFEDEKTDTHKPKQEDDQEKAASAGHYPELAHELGHGRRVTPPAGAHSPHSFPASGQGRRHFPALGHSPLGSPVQGPSRRNTPQADHSPHSTPEPGPSRRYTPSGGPHPHSPSPTAKSPQAILPPGQTPRSSIGSSAGKHGEKSEGVPHKTLWLTVAKTAAAKPEGGSPSPGQTPKSSIDSSPVKQAQKSDGVPHKTLWLTVAKTAAAKPEGGSASPGQTPKSSIDSPPAKQAQKSDGVPHKALWLTVAKTAAAKPQDGTPTPDQTPRASIDSPGTKQPEAADTKEKNHKGHWQKTTKKVAAKPEDPLVLIAEQLLARKKNQRKRSSGDNVQSTNVPEPSENSQRNSVDYDQVDPKEEKRPSALPDPININEVPATPPNQDTKDSISKSAKYSTDSNKSRGTAYPDSYEDPACITIQKLRTCNLTLVFPILLFLGVLLLIISHLNRSFQANLNDTKFLPLHSTFVSSLAGIAFIVAAIFGFTGLLSRWRCFLVNSFWLVLTGIFALLFIGLFGLLRTSETFLVGHIRFLMRSFKSDEDNYRVDVNHTLDQMQLRFQCCGIQGPGDWNQNDSATEEDLVDKYCCYLPSSTNTSAIDQNCVFSKLTTSETSMYFKKGCLPQLLQFATTYRFRYAAVVVIVATIAVILSIFIACYVRRYYTIATTTIAIWEPSPANIVAEQTDTFVFAQNPDKYDVQVKEAIIDNYTTFENLHDLESYLTTASDINSQIISKQPQEAAQDILWGNNVLLQKLDNSIKFVEKEKPTGPP